MVGKKKKKLEILYLLDGYKEMLNSICGIQTKSRKSQVLGDVYLDPILHALTNIDSLYEMFIWYTSPRKTSEEQAERKRRMKIPKQKIFRGENVGNPRIEIILPYLIKLCNIRHKISKLPRWFPKWKPSKKPSRKHKKQKKSGGTRKKRHNSRRRR